MTSFSSVSIRPPKDWQAFERHSRLLFQYVLDDPHTQNNGRPGQRQHGVDIFGYRGGDGDLVGIQCKGKDANYGGSITEAELKAEVEKTEKFRPSLKEFILATTAPDDAKIQKSARLLEDEVRKAGRELKIAVWGWERLEQEINRYPAAIKAFHPDASPFTDTLLENDRQIQELLKQQHAETQTLLLAVIESRPPPTQIANVDAEATDNTLEKYINDEINTYRNLITSGRPKTAIQLLTALQQRLPDTASNRVRFRIIANTAVAHHRLGEFNTAATLFLEAAEFDPDDPVSIANKIASLLIQGRREEAHEVAVHAATLFPDNADIALQRLQAHGPEETVDSIWSTLASSVANKIPLLLFRVVALREQGRFEWRQTLDEAVRTYPDNLQLQVLHAESVLDRVLSADRSALGAPSTDAPSQAELTEAAKIFEGAWKDSLNCETAPDMASMHNGALAYNILSNLNAASAILDLVPETISVTEETKRLRISLLRRSGKLADASKVAETLAASPQNDIYRADLVVEVDPAAARHILGGRIEYVERRDIIAAAQIFIESFLAQETFTEALTEAQRLEALLPADAHSQLSLHRIHSVRGDATAGLYLDEAVHRVTDQTDFVTRFLVCQSLRDAGRFDDIVDLLSGHVSTNHDSPALRELIAAAANADRRVILSSILDLVPQELFNLPFYSRAQVALAIRSGNIIAAEQYTRTYLRVRPRSLDMHLQLIQILARQEKAAELQIEVARPAADFDGAPEELMSFAQFKEAFGDWREAYRVAYRTWLENQNDATVALRYVGVFLRPGHSSELEASPTEVAENAAVGLHGEDGSHDVFIVEPDPSLRPTPRHLAPSHGTAALLIGKAVGATIRFVDASKATIEWIKPKELHALHQILENFQKLYPETQGLERVQIEPGQPGGFQPIFDRVRRRHDAIQKVFDSYATGQLPIALVARSLGTETVEAFIGLIQSGRSIFVCEGSQSELDAAFAAIDHNAQRGCVLDGITLHIVRSLNLHEAVKAVCGPIGIVDGTMLRIQAKIQEIEERIDEPDTSLIWRDGQIYRDEVSPEYH